MREHHAHAPRHVSAGVLTVSDSKTRETDEGGATAVQLLEDAGHAVAWRELVRDDADAIRDAAATALDREDVHALVVTGGTGVTRRDVTPEAIVPLFEKSLPGFGELFRALSFKDVGAAAMASRATAGIAHGKPVFLLPGSPHAVALAVRELVAPEVGHLTSLANRG